MDTHSRLHSLFKKATLATVHRIPFAIGQDSAINVDESSQNFDTRVICKECFREPENARRLE